MTLIIRKEGKAHWVFECRRCHVRGNSQDYFRALEHQQWHERTLEHATKPMADSLGIFAEALTELAERFVDSVASAFKPLADVLAPAPNRPHDPTLLRDRRKWGGR
ncbi:hypothetical protein ACIQTZ_00435 [Paenarthrobacter sp. NPDC090520]|uniref:hypothetical protein n=1 Tax=Paenarthrobacter sp. NPDC090520 TaxID=3364382 RepID=UPI0037F262EA